MYISGIKETFLDYPDNESLAVIVFFEGCSHNCYNCQNKELQTQNNDHFLSFDETVEAIESHCRRSMTDKIVFSGGDPFYKPDDIIPIIDTLGRKGYSICVYTGSTIDQVLKFFEDYEKKNNVIIHKPLWLKCGLYREDLRVPNSGKFDDKFVLASTNQAFFKLKETNYIHESNRNILCFKE